MKTTVPWLTGLLEESNAQDAAGISDRMMENGRTVPRVAFHDDELDQHSSVPRVQHQDKRLLQDGS